MGRKVKNVDQMIVALDRHVEALKLRRDGVTFEEIAKRLDYQSSAGAYAAVTAALKKVLREPAEELRVLELERIDGLWEVAYKMAMGGNLFAIDRCLKLAERRAALLGLDAPKEHLVAGTLAIGSTGQLDGLDGVQLIAFLGQLVAVSQQVVNDGGIVDGSFTES